MKDSLQRQILEFVKLQIMKDSLQRQILELWYFDRCLIAGSYMVALQWTITYYTCVILHSVWVVAWLD